MIENRKETSHFPTLFFRQDVSFSNFEHKIAVASSQVYCCSTPGAPASSAGLSNTSGGTLWQGSGQPCQQIEEQKASEQQPILFLAAHCLDNGGYFIP
jgi:hypothetical protein